jgi:putative ABC transport system substrate-binding protein
MRLRRLEAFRQGLRDLGYVEGTNIIFDYRHAGSSFERLPELAAELISLKPDVLVAVTTNAAIAAKSNQNHSDCFYGRHGSNYR